MNNCKQNKMSAPGAPKPFASWARGLAAAASLSLLLAGCGPGVGGTGVGPGQYLSAFGATAAPVCLSSLGPALQCTASTATTSEPGGTSAGNPGLLDGTGLVRYVDSTGRVRLSFSGNSTELQVSCGPLRFDGVFGQAPDQQQQFYGSVDSPSYQGSARLQLTASEGGLSLALMDDLGRTLLDPLLLKPTMADAALEPCAL